MAKKQFKKELLIICEGEKTEPIYLDYFAQVAKANYIWDTIEIFPKSTTDPNPIAPESVNRRRDKKTILQPARENDKNRLESYLIEQYGQSKGKALYCEYKAQPIRYVFEAVERQKEIGYSSIWVVFDLDGANIKHAKEAFDLAEQEGVNIAFSNRSFEIWFLLHFMGVPPNYDETNCKTPNNQNTGKKEADCGKKNPKTLANCAGTGCLVGYLRQHFLPEYEKHLHKGKNTLIYRDIMQKFGENLDFAIANAEKLCACHTTIHPGGTPIYEFGRPYADVHQLMKVLLNK
jgi:RloB-like protein